MKHGSSNAKEIKRIDCLKCACYYVTWDESFPKGCRAYGFKSLRVPSMEVFTSSGTECQLFEVKKK